MRDAALMHSRAGFENSDHPNHQNAGRGATSRCLRTREAMKQNEVSPQHVEAITHLAADLSNVIDQARRANPDLSWLDTVMVAAVACRAVAAAAIAKDPDLNLDSAREQMFKQFVNVLMLPAELVQVVPDNGDEGGTYTCGIPVRRH